MSYNYSWSWSSGSNCGARRQCTTGRQCTRTVTTYTSDGRQITTTYRNGQPVVYPSQTSYGGGLATTVTATPSASENSSSAAIESAPKQDGDFTKFELECLDEHNKMRAKHGCPPLKLNRSICNYSQEWANYLVSRNVLQHRSNNRYGENLYMSGGMYVDGRTAVKAWYDEIKSYRFGYGGFSMATGHFTQVVWKNSKELGIAFATRGNSTYVVANYDPPGNYANQFQQNVPPPSR